MINTNFEKLLLKYFNKTEHKCYKQDCNKIAIGSHAISRNISLASISVDGNMKYFKSKRSGKESKTLILDDIGMYEASKFQGFCLEHDGGFEFLGKNSYKYNVKQILMQCYRSICYSLFKIKPLADQFNNDSFDFVRELVMKPSVIETLLTEVVAESNDSIEVFTEKLGKDRTLIECLRGRLEELIDEEVLRFSYEYDKFYDLKQTLEQTLEILEETKTNEPLVKFESLSDPFGVGFFYKRIDMNIPVALLNQHLIDIRGNATFLFFTVIPYEDGTEIYWIFDNKYRHVFLNEWEKMLMNEIEIINRIESSMMHCEQWFIDPKVINRIPPERLKIITEDIYFIHERNPFKDYDLSIFDELRLNLLENLDEQKKLREKNKINSIATREPSHVRDKKLRESVLKSPSKIIERQIRQT
ncbi:hypothetical protein [Paenibacillus guangzhouensis]|uniref:hypothetical protein n=1 Tax=Paenibacillus guangzhouensis TaxID=1473112 RepID=UPI00187B6FEC|nr:hypothetical protein [Paenibacillus guangzhouensis]